MGLKESWGQTWEGLGAGREAEEARSLLPCATGWRPGEALGGGREEVPSRAGHSQRLGWGGAGDGEQI